jgi:hypothetical protein
MASRGADINWLRKGYTAKFFATTIPLADEKSTPVSWLGGLMFKYWSTGHLN